MKTKLFTLTFLFFSTLVFSQELPEQIIQKFFKEYRSVGASKAVDNIYSTNQWNSRIKDGIESLKTTLEKLTEDNIGKYYGYELIVAKQFSTSFMMYSYMVKYDRQPLRFMFKFYKPNDKWILYSFQIDDSMDDEIEEAGKLYRLDLR